MISIIISSYQPKYYFALEKNIAETVGVPYEIIKIENPGLMGIAEAYNKGAKKARFENLLFLHEDVLFHTQNWGEKLIKHLEDMTTGIVGVAGSDYVPTAPSGWNVGNNSHHFINIIQSFGTENPITERLSMNCVQQSLALDGVFLSMRKDVFQQFHFNEKLKGFHSYDLDISLRVALTMKNYVINNVLIEHFSKGTLNCEWFQNNIQVRKDVGYNFNEKRIPTIEFHSFLSFLDTYLKYNSVSTNSILRSLRYLPFGHLSLNHYYQIGKKIFYYLHYQISYNQKYQNKS